MDIVNSILGKIGECMLDSIKVHFGYLKHYEDNIAELERQVATLEKGETDVLKAIQAAKRNGEEIREIVKHWITSVDGLKVEAKKFLEDNVQANKRCFKGWFPNMRTLYRLSREAERKHEAIEGLLEEQEKFDINVSLPAPPPGIDSITSKDFVLFQTTKLSMEKVMNALKEDSIDFVGIHGMGGVGKTTLVNQIARKCKEERLFDNVVMAVVSQAVNIESIQKKIADFLGLKLQEENEILRASRLYDRLKSESKILVILDDLWAGLDLPTIGIPSGEDHKGCKVVITTRRRQVCTAMGRSVQTTRIVSLDVLTKQESWELFKLQAGDIIESPTMRSVAEKVVKECGCLPIALVTVGKAMRGKDVEEWKEAALELEKSKPVNIEGMDENVFNCIKLSYDYLRDEEAKACFLLCCLFPEDYDIETETLVRYGLGLNIFKRIDKIQEARRRGYSIINNLKASSLLVAGKGRGCVKMHDVVRDVAKEIASDRYFVKAGESLKEWPNELTRDGYNGVGGISLMRNEIRKYPDALECPDLEILLMQNNNVEQEIPEEVFKGMKKLRVFDQSYNKDRSLEPSFGLLTNLRSLIIDGTRHNWKWGIFFSPLLLRGNNVLGELKMLQVVSLRHFRFEEPLDALRKMKNLMLLDLAYSENCSSLFNFAEDCNFPQLEELYLTDPMTYTVAELMKCCPRLNVLWFCMYRISKIPDNFVIPHLDHFCIYAAYLDSQFKFEGDYLENILYLDGRAGQLDDLALPNRFGTLLPSASMMTLRYLKGLRNMLPYVVVAKDSLTVLKKLDVEECNELEYLMNMEETIKILQPTCFLHLEELCLRNLRRFRGLCDIVIVSYIPYAFLKIQKLYISQCPEMSNIGAPLNLLRRMRQLEVLEIRYCKALEYLFDLKEEVEDAIEEEGEGILANLTALTLESLCNLKELWKGNIGLVHLRNLKTAEIESCPKLKVLFHWSVAQRLEQLQELKVSYCKELEDTVGRERGEEAVQKGPTGLVPFSSLKAVVIKSCPKLKVLFHWSVAQRLEQLQELKVSYCYELEDTVGRERGEEAVQKGPTGLVPFCSLKTAEIERCLKLKVVFHWSVAQRLEQLQELKVSYCYELEETIGRETGEEVIHNGPTGLVPFCNLKTVYILSCPKLKVVFHWSVAQRLEQLQQLNLSFCNELEETVGRELGEEAIHNGPTGLVPFRNLKTVYILSCPKLKVVFHWSVAQRLEQLQELIVEYCDELEEIVGREIGEEAVHEGPAGLVPFRNLKTVKIRICQLKVLFHWSIAQRLEQLQDLRVDCCKELEEVLGSETGEEVVHKGFCNLKTAEIESCPKLKVLFHWSVAQRLEQLQDLTVRDCEELEEIVGREIGEEAVHEGPTGLVPFRNLKKVDISRCPKLKVVFHWPVAQRLEQLRELNLSFCNELEEIVERETGEEAINKVPAGLVPFRNLSTVDIFGCPKLKVVFHWSVAQRLEQLEDLSVWSCDELEAIVGTETGEEAVHDKVLLPKLGALTLAKLPKLNGFYTGNLPGSQSTPRLSTVRMRVSKIPVIDRNLDAAIKCHKGLLKKDY